MPAFREYVVRSLLAAGCTMAAAVPQPVFGQEITILAVGDIDVSRRDPATPFRDLRRGVERWE